MIRGLNQRLARLERRVENESKYYYYPPVNKDLPLADQIVYIVQQERKAEALGKIARPFNYDESEGER